MLEPCDPQSHDRPFLLALDTTAGACSAAVLGPDTDLGRSLPMPHGHSRHLLGLIDALLAEGGLAPSRIGAVAFGAGPGSFTGLRIACGVAQGLGFGWNRPLVAVDAPRTLALQAADHAPPQTDWVFVALDLRMGEVCIAAFRCDASLRAAAWADAEVAPRLGAPERVATAFTACGARAPVLAGDGWRRHPTLRGSVPEAADPVEAAVQPDARAVARLGASGLAGGRAIDALRATPTYLRDKVALDVGEQAELRAARAAGASR